MAPSTTVKKELKELKLKRGQIKGKVTRLKTFLNTQTDNPDVVEIEMRIKNFQGLITEFEDVQNDIENITGTVDNDERDSFENSYFDAMVNASKILDAAHVNTRANANPVVAQLAQINVKLPQLNLPNFDGSYGQWLTFYNTFNALIDKNTQLGKTEKLHYLKACLKGDAAQIIQSMEITDVNYDIAWRMLKNRYENKKLIIHSHVKAIFELTPVKNEANYALRKLIDNFSKNIRALNALGQPTDSWDTLLVYIVSSKLDAVTKRQFEEAMNKNTNPTINDLIGFLEERCQLLETIETKKPQKSYREEKTFTHLTTQGVSCAFCNGAHYNYNCERFAKWSFDERLAEVKKHKLCNNCLRPGHYQRECRGTSCKHCDTKHHSLLHPPKTKPEQCFKRDKADTTSTTSNDKASEGPNTSLTSLHVSNHNTQIVLATVRVLIQDYTGRYLQCRALLDSGSMSNFITSSLVKKLRLQTNRLNCPVGGISDATINITRETKTTISSVDKQYKRELEQFLIINKITGNLPQTSVQTTQTPNGLDLADQEFNKSQPIDILLGASIFFDSLLNGQERHDSLIFQNTKFGWVASGPVTATGSQIINCNMVISNEALNQQLQRFWKVDETEERKDSFTQEERECEEHFKKNYRRNADGRFEVALPFKDNVGELGDSEDTAIKRFYSLERRLQRDDKLREMYERFMKEYEELNHMTELKQNDIKEDRMYYLPHHGVLKESSATTKLRVVFDASAKTTSGLSLNDVLKVGPIIQADLFNILIKFRKHNVVISGDIEKMFRQVMLREEDRKYQCIFWRANPQEELKRYCLNTVTYGTAPASYLAVRALQQAAIDNEHIYPVASKIIKTDFYMDDLITGGTSVEEVKNLKTQIDTILRQAGFSLRKWASNKEEVLKDTENNDANYIITNKDNQKTLGLSWDTIRDELTYSVDLNTTNEVTKRSILSCISKIFDPLGALSPITMKAKLIVQNLWKEQLDWDDPIPMMLRTAWIKFQEQLKNVNKIRLPRQVTMTNYTRLELHGFSDSSEIAYGACVYIRTINDEGKTLTNLLCAKSRLAPLRTVNLPRLELCAALMLARLMRKAANALDTEIQAQYLWSDSTIALSWIAAEPNCWKTFVSNRVAEIQELTAKMDWRHISSSLNPADLITRGLNPQQLQTNELWWHGPSFLNEEEAEWPPQCTYNQTDVPERRIEKPLTLTVCTNDDICKRFSDLHKLQRVIAYILRFRNNCDSKTTERLSGELTTKELNKSLIVLIKNAQISNFYEEIKCLKTNKPLAKNSKLLSLNPFLDEHGLIRVGGRIRNANIDYDQKHQIVIPSTHHLTTLIVQNEHLRHLHGGPQLVLAAVRNKFWPLNGRSTIRKILRSCIKCFRTKPTNMTTQMGDLPSSRLTPTRPFLEVGVDFAGPIMIKDGTLRTRKLIKGYICIFVCFSSKAVHIELATGLSTQNFLSILKRFVSRRGLCKEINSDNGTNFVGSKNELKRIFDFIKRDIPTGEIRDFLLKNEITWKFIPPRAPHFGGLWEAAVKSAKFHLVRIIGNSHLTYEALYTIMCQVEAIMNSRPITNISTDPNDLEPLTPGHILIGGPLTAIPDNFDGTSTTSNQTKAYLRTQNMVQQFWTRWSSEYLTTLQQRSKWKTEASTKLHVGDLVIIKEDNLPPLHWKMGRVVNVYPGNDGIVRVADIKTMNGILRRNITKLCPLPIMNV